MAGGFFAFKSCRLRLGELRKVNEQPLHEVARMVERHVLARRNVRFRQYVAPSPLNP